MKGNFIHGYLIIFQVLSLAGFLPSTSRYCNAPAQQPSQRTFLTSFNFPPRLSPDGIPRGKSECDRAGETSVLLPDPIQSDDSKWTCRILSAMVVRRGGGGVRLRITYWPRTY